MDLPYPSFKDVDDKDQCVLSTMNKKLRSTIWSMKDLGKNQQHLPKNTRNDLIRCIEKDRAGKLQKIINNTKINLQTEIGTKGSKWSLVHFCARWNASSCLQLILKQSYQQNPTQYLCLVNNKTSEGYTPLMICVLYQSDQLLEQLLDYGGVDVLLVDNNRVSAYQMAVSSKNEMAINSVVKYQRNNRVTTFLNTYKLSTKFCAPKQERTCLQACEALWKWVIREPKQKQLQQTPTSRTFTGTSFVDNQFLPIPSSISNDIQSVSQYDIEWYRLGSLFQPRVVQLFQNCAIYQVKQLNFVIKHSLTVFQTILKFPWLLKSKIKRGQIQGMYECELFPKGLRQTVAVDDFIPCLKATKQPMFFSTTKEAWSMILQKAWAKTYGCYTAARDIKPKFILQQLMGYHAQTFDVQENQEGLYNSLKCMSEKEYVIVLTTKKQSLLKYQESGQETFGILSFCEKDSKQYILINCPFLLPSWKECQRTEPLALRLIRAHYTSPNQMAIWLQISQVLANFESFTISYSSPCLLRTELRAKVKQLVFLRLECQEEVSAKNILLKMFEVSHRQTEQVTIRTIEVGKNDIIDSACVVSHQDSLGRIKCVSLSQGNFLCKFQIQNQGTGRHVGIVCYSQCKLKYQVLDQQLGKIQWIYLLRDKISISLEISQKPVVQHFYNYSLILQKTQSIEDSLVTNYNLDQVEYFVQGRKHSDGISLEKQDDYWYAIVKNKTLGEGISLKSF